MYIQVQILKAPFYLWNEKRDTRDKVEGDDIININMSNKFELRHFLKDVFGIFGMEKFSYTSWKFLVSYENRKVKKVLLVVCYVLLRSWSY